MILKVKNSDKGTINFIIDDSDSYLLKYKWSTNNQGYARAYVNKTSILLHRLIMDAPDGKIVDHINRNKKDNRKSNLRITTLKQNQGNRKMNKNNTTGYKGVTKFRNKWRAEIASKYLGLFDTAQEANEAYKQAHKEYFDPI